MLITEILSNPSREFFQDIPLKYHRLLMSYCDMSSELTVGYDGFIKVNCLDLLKQKFIACGFDEFDPTEVLREFHAYCQTQRKECYRIMQTGFLDDMKEFVLRFIDKQ